MDFLGLVFSYLAFFLIASAAISVVYMLTLFVWSMVVRGFQVVTAVLSRVVELGDITEDYI